MPAVLPEVGKIGPLRVRLGRKTVQPRRYRQAFHRRLDNRLDPIGLHSARHAAASVLIAAGVNIKALSTYLGHASITITLDRYGHRFPGNEEEAARLVDSYIERAVIPAVTNQ